MTLAEMADYVSAKVRMRDSESVALCKQFIRQRHEMIWDMALWRDTVYQLGFTILTSPGTPPPPPNSQEVWATGIHYLPTCVDKILGLRTDDQSLAVDQEETLYRVNLDEYEEEGDPIKYLVMPRACAHYTLYTGWSFQWVDPLDTGQQVQIDYVDENFDVRRRIITPPVSTGSLQIRQLDRIIKPITTGRLQFFFTPGSSMYIEANEIEYPQRLRIRIIPHATADENRDYKALVKRTVIPMSLDGDKASIRNLDNVLIAFAQADMLEYTRQYSKAQSKAAEGLALLDSLKKSATIQESSFQRLQPEPDGYAAGDIPGKTDW